MHCRGVSILTRPGVAERTNERPIVIDFRSHPTPCGRGVHCFGNLILGLGDGVEIRLFGSTNVGLSGGLEFFSYIYLCSIDKGLPPVRAFRGVVILRKLYN